MRGRMYHHSQTHPQSSHDKFQTASKLRIGNQSSALCPGGPFTPPDHGKEGRRERIGLRVRTERKVWFTCRDARSVRPACTRLISNPDVISDTRAVCPYTGMHKHLGSIFHKKCRDSRSVRPACTMPIPNPDVARPHGPCPYIGMQHGGDYCSLMPRTGRPESLGDEPTWITWFVVNDQKT